MFTNGLHGFTDILYTIICLLVVLSLATYIDYKWPVNFFGFYMPRSYQIWQWLVFGPIVMFIYGICYALFGAIMLSPILSLLFGKVWLALACFVALGFLTPYASLFKVNGMVFKFDFPLDIVTGYIAILILGLGFGAVGCFLLSPIYVFVNLFF